MTRPVHPAARAAALVVVGSALGAVSGCSHLPRPHWPWHHQKAQPPEEVHELVATAPDGSAMNLPQYWKRNTLIVDLHLAGASGSAVLKPREHTLWPVRVAFRVMPGQFGALEVRARERVVLPITAAGTQPLDLELAPGVFIMKSPELTVRWGPSEVPAPEAASQ